MTRARPSLAPFVVVLTLSVAACDASPDGDQAADTTAAAAAETTASAGSTEASASGAFLDPNAATREQLLALRGMDSAAVDAVVRGRPYDNMTAVDRALASHLTEAERDSVYTRMWKPIDLNTASDEEILLIPGVGPRMQHEFEEYRPYNSIERFRREIGKYVDSAEVARLERYVTIR
jgi:DNA uptake protein ComE-like DNA-binding protein